MSGSNIRLERIQRLIKELEYEITRGVMEHEIEPDLHYSFMLPGGPTGRVAIELHVYPVRREQYFAPDKSTLRAIDGGRSGSE